MVLEDGSSAAARARDSSSTGGNPPTTYGTHGAGTTGDDDQMDALFHQHAHHARTGVMLDDGDENTDGESESEEEDEVPIDLAHLSPEEQQSRIIFRSLRMMGLGSIMVLLFSDPMVDVLAMLGRVTGR